MKGGQNDLPQVFGISGERKNIFNEILAIPSLWHKTVCQLSNFEKCPKL